MLQVFLANKSKRSSFYTIYRPSWFHFFFLTGESVLKDSERPLRRRRRFHSTVVTVCFTHILQDTDGGVFGTHLRQVPCLLIDNFGMVPR